MNILHIAAHMGDGAGRAIGGLAALDASLGNTHKILLLEAPKKLNHIKKCRANGVEVIINKSMKTLEKSIAETDIVTLSWWGGKAMEKFLSSFPKVPCRIMLWSHKNGFFDPPLSNELVQAFDKFLATSPFTLTRPEWKNAALVYGFGDFNPKKIKPKDNYSLSSDDFIIGYVGMPSYKRLPPNAADYFKAALAKVPNARFVMAGEYSEEFRDSIRNAGLENHVTFLGWTHNVYKLLKSFDIFGYLLKPDTSATTENSVIEAMATALPVVMSRYPVGAYVLGENNGFLFSTPDEYALACKKLFESENLRREMGERARNYILSVAGNDDNLIRFQKACEEVIKLPKKLRKFGADK